MHDFIAEIGTSHLGSLEKAKRMIEAARDAGATTAKFQWVIADEIVSMRAGSIALPSGITDIYQYFLSVERDAEFYATLKSYTEACGLQFLCSVFGLKSLRLLLQLKPKRVKIASPEINHVELMEELARHEVAVVLSGGVSTLVDLVRAVDVLRGGKVTNIAILRCVTEYPASPYSYSVQLLEKYASLFHCQYGVSDHTQNPTMLPSVAAACGSIAVEKHVALPREHDHAAISPDDPIALLPEQFAHMVQKTTEIAALYKTQGMQAAQAEVKKRYGEEEVAAVMGTAQPMTTHKSSAALKHGCAVLLPHYFSTRRSLFACQGIAAGEKLTAYNCSLWRSEHNTAPGIPTEALPAIMNKPLRAAVPQGAPIRFDHFL